MAHRTVRVIPILLALSISLLALVGCSSVSPEQTPLSSYSSPLEMVKDLREFGAYCEEYIPEGGLFTKTTHESGVPLTAIWCNQKDSTKGSYFVQLYSSNSDFLRALDYECERLASDVDLDDPELLVFAYGENWDAYFFGAQRDLTIQDIATALGGKTGSNRLDYCLK